MSRFQFSIRFLLVATAAVAAGAATAHAEPSKVTMLATQFLSLVFGTGAVIGVYQTTGAVRVFWIGTAIALCPAVFQSAHGPLFVFGDVGGAMAYPSVWPLWCVAPINGLVAILLYWLFASRKDDGRP
jgi:hypothetical protein